jgi:hypothetical protein
MMYAEQIALSKGSSVVVMPSWLKTATRRLMQRQMRRGIYAEDFENNHFKERGIYAGGWGIAASAGWGCSISLKRQNDCRKKKFAGDSLYEYGNI